MKTPRGPATRVRIVPCECVFDLDTMAICYCPLHAAAPAMREALREALADIRQHNADYHYRTMETQLLEWENVAGLETGTESCAH